MWHLQSGKECYWTCRWCVSQADEEEGCNYNHVAFGLKDRVTRLSGNTQDMLKDLKGDRIYLDC